MSDSYTYDPDTWYPPIAGAVAGAIAAVVAGIVSLPLRSPDDVFANSLTVVIVSIVLGVISGSLWRRLRAMANAQKLFAWSMVGAFVASMAAIAIVDLTILSSLIPYAAPLAAIIFITLGFFTPVLSRLTAPVWVAAIPILIALGIGIGLLGRGAAGRAFCHRPRGCGSRGRRPPCQPTVDRVRGAAARRAVPLHAT